ncbi:MAG: HEAT repeat domain-containing protein [Planctomycetia bacterium]
MQACRRGLGRAQAGEQREADARAALAALDGSDARAAFRLALELEAGGQGELARQAYEVVLLAEPDHLAARRALGYERVEGVWRTGDDLRRARGLVRHGERWLTSEEFADVTRPQRAAAEQAAGEARVRAQLARIATQDPEEVRAAQRELGALDDRFKLAPLCQALRCEPPALRRFVAGELARLDDPLAVPALLKRVIYDPDAGVREAVAATLRQMALPSVVQPLVRALDSRTSETRVRAAEALGRLGDVGAVGAVVLHMEKRSGNYPRVYMTNVTQVTYIADYDVEVAQTSFIADPVVGVLQEGVVHAFHVLATEQTFDSVERVAYRRALAGMVGQDLGDVKAWAAFWRENRARLERESDERYAQAARERAQRAGGSTATAR